MARRRRRSHTPPTLATVDGGAVALFELTSGVLVVAATGEGVLMCYRTVRRSDNDHGRVMCGIVLDEPVVSRQPPA